MATQRGGVVLVTTKTSSELGEPTMSMLPDYCIINGDERLKYHENNSEGYDYDDHFEAPIAYCTRKWSFRRKRWHSVRQHFGFWMHDYHHKLSTHGTLLTSNTTGKKFKWYYLDPDDSGTTLDAYPFKGASFGVFARRHRRQSQRRKRDAITSSIQRASRREADRRLWRVRPVALEDPLWKTVETAKYSAYIMELLLWKIEIMRFESDKYTRAHMECRSQLRLSCKTNVVIPLVLSFLLPN